MRTLLPSDRIATLHRTGPKASIMATTATARMVALNTKCSLVFRTSLFVVDTADSGATNMARCKIVDSRGLGLQITGSMLPGVEEGISRIFNGQLVVVVEVVGREINRKAHYINLDSPRAPHKSNNNNLSNNKPLHPRMMITLSGRQKTSRSKIRVEMRAVCKTLVLEKARKCLHLPDNLQPVHKRRKVPNSVLLSRQKLRLHLLQKLCQTLYKR